jgi:hypothetical protein
MVGQRAGRGLYHLNITVVRVLLLERALTGKHLVINKFFFDLYYHHFFFLWIIAENKKAKLKLWHERLGHVSLNTIQKMFQEK